MSSLDQNVKKSTVFQYDPLSQEAQEIRILRIQPSGEGTGRDDGIICLLETISLNQKPEYTALSYVWGDPNVTIPISVNGKSIHITANLNSALLRIRRSSPDILLWVDAICINQQDEHEKSWQVGLMLQIYRKAAKVLVWLGPSADDSDFIMDGFQDLGEDALTTGLPYFDGQELLEAIEVAYRAMYPLNHFKSPPIGQPGTFEEMMFRRFYGKNRCKIEEIFPPPAVEAFLRRTWWKRVWVLQEFCVARSVSFMCGDKDISADVLQSALILIQLYNDAIAQQDSSKLAMERVYDGMFVGLENYVDNTKSMWKQIYTTDDHHRLMFQQRRFYRNNKRPTFCDLLQFASGVQTDAALQATDPRDLVFALLGMSADTDVLGLKPDYTKSIRQVYEEVAISLIRDGWNIFSLGNDVNLDAVRRKEWASWVPDWRRVFAARNRRRQGVIYHKHVAEFSAGIGRVVPNIYKQEGPSLLEIKCSLVDAVAEVKVLPLSKVETRSDELMMPHHDVSPAFIRSVQEAELFAKDQKHPLVYLPGDRDVVWRTLVADRILLDLPRRRTGFRPNKDARTEFRDAFRAIAEDRTQKHVMDEQKAKFEQCMIDYYQGKLGTGPENVHFISMKTTTNLSTLALTVRVMLAGRALIKTKKDCYA